MTSSINVHVYSDALVVLGTAGVVTQLQLYQVVSGTMVAAANEDILSTTPDATFRWDPSGQQWIFNLSTKNLAAGRTYFYRVTLNDASAISFNFGVK